VKLALTQLFSRTTHFTQAYPFVARKLLREDRPEIQKALQEVLYGRGGALSSRRLAALVNGALGAVARSEGGAFVDLDGMPEEAAGGKEAASFLLSEAAGSLWKTLEPELLTGCDLLLRQAIRRAAPAAFSALRPRLPVLGFIGPAPQDVPGPVLVPTAGGGVRVAVVTGARLVEALAPALSREEELYALSLVDLTKEFLGEDAATLVRGEGLQDSAAVVRVALAALEASPSLVSQILVPILRAAPQVNGHTTEKLTEARGVLDGLSVAERARADDLVGRLGQSLVKAFDKRLRLV